MAKHIQKFTQPFIGSSIPFFLAEILTDGSGTMVDLIFRFANDRFCSVLNTTPETITGKRFSRLFPASQLEQLSPLQTVAFSGSSLSFPYTNTLGQTYQIICFQPMYGMVSCMLNSKDGESPPAAEEFLTDQLPGVAGVLELSRSGVRLLSFSQQLCEITGREYRELLDFYADDLSALVLAEDWTGLLQVLLDSARSSQSIDHTFRILRKDDSTLWVTLWAKPLSRERGAVTFSTLLLDTDAQIRAQERGAAARQEAETTLFQYTSLFNSLPSGYCVFQEESTGLTHLRISHGLSSLLGYSLPELYQHLSEEPMWGIPPLERESLQTAARQAWASGMSLRRACPLRVNGEGIRWGLIEAVRQPQSDGTALIFAACTDITAEKEEASKLEFRSRLCDLLLDDPTLISFDYDPNTDVSHIYRRDKEGRKITRTIPNYLHDLEHTTVIHPQDQKQLAAAVKRAVDHPTVETVEYRGNYDGQGWRWYRISWVSLFDSKGNVYRLVGKSEDITRRKASAQRFNDLRTQQKKLDCGTLVTAQLDLTANRILDARGCTPHLTQILFGNTADACLSHIQEQIPTAEQREAFSQMFCRETLLDNFHSGQLWLHLEHRFSPDTSAILWAESIVQLIEDPESGHPTAFFTIWDIDSQHRQTTLLHTLAQRDYDLVLTVNTANGHCRSYGHPLPEDMDYQTLTARYQAVFGEPAPLLDTVRRQLETNAVWSGSLPDGQPGTFCWSWLDQEDGLLLLTLWNTKKNIELK